MRYFIISLLCILWSTGALASDQVFKFAWDRSPEAKVVSYQLHRKSALTDEYTPVGDAIPQVAEGEEPAGQDAVPYEKGATYWYVVTAKSDILESGYSNSVEVSPLQIPTLRLVLAVEVTIQ